MLAVAVVNEAMSSLTAMIMSTLRPLVRAPHVIMVVACPPPIMVTELLMFKVPVLASYAGLAIRPLVRVYVFGGRLMVLVCPVFALVSRTASRKLQSLATPLHALVMGETGTGSSVRFTVRLKGEPSGGWGKGAGALAPVPGAAELARVGAAAPFVAGADPAKGINV